MKLVDILARELKAWPWPNMLEVSQMSSGELHTTDLMAYTVTRYTLCDDYATEVVTRGQWQAAVNALKIADGIADADAGNLTPLSEIKERYVWNGEGLPPVGAACESNNHEGVWESCKILAHSEMSYGEQVVVFQAGDKITFSNPRYFRPIRTPEQIAEETAVAERISIATVLEKCGYDLSASAAAWIAARLWEAGLRIQVQP